MGYYQEFIALARFFAVSGSSVSEPARTYFASVQGAMANVAELYLRVQKRIASFAREAGAEIPTRQDGQARTVEAITLDLNRAFEAAVRRDPANWFWVHNRWKPIQSRRPKPASPAEPMPAAAPATKGE